MAKSSIASKSRNSVRANRQSSSFTTNGHALRPFSIIITVFIAINEAVTQDCCTKCAKNLTLNPFQNVGLYKEPIKTKELFNEWSVCGQVFQTRGSCCNQAELHEYSRFWTEDLRKHYTLMFLKSERYKIHIKKWKIFTDFIKANKDSFIARIESTPDLEPASFDKNIFLNQWVPILEHFGKFKDSDIIRHEELARADSLSCFTRFMDLRLNALCLRCSPGSNAFYVDATTSYKIDQKACLRIASKCVPVFTYMANMTTFYDIMWRIKKYHLGEWDKRLGTKGFTLDQLKMMGRIMQNYQVYQDEAGFQFKSGEEQTDDLLTFCKFFSLSQINQNLEGFETLWDVGIAIAESMIKDGSVPTGVDGLGLDVDYTVYASIEANLFRDRDELLNPASVGSDGGGERRLLENWKLDFSDGLGFIEPVEPSKGADLIGGYDSGVNVVIVKTPEPETTGGVRLRVFGVWLGLFMLIELWRGPLLA